ncbi:hypothetical protein L211DRAFT_846376 [Terfezia boudieri ATCC MYA-4762]|uniref:Cyclin N-terminal domain-containing protein n=1 Tax=Terfezia boudieri ATCC MYA-4762 TaxID=1051890 RepID=A0A3N4M2J9_9PEZI|nr:hypothetical protein L211DRAFT_846376 [Terfezia boudieri ATCC MYA-4762]
MSTHSPDRSIDRSQISKHPYSPSIASSVSSSASSIFSLAASVSSSVASSIASLTSIQSSEGVLYLGDIERHAWSQEQRSKEDIRQSISTRTLRVPPPAVEQRQHQRRAQRCTEVNRTACLSDSCSMPPVPALVRQAERKTNFVDNLVAQIVETIWPTYMNGKAEASAGKGVLPLRTFIQETLRRSRTSYSTLQVALYYLVIVRPHIPKGDFSDMSQENAQQMRALQCGRRMFLAALILASKYLQDRNYSARAWSRISGLQTTEININEMAFLDAVNWRLHISETIFQKWADLVVKYTSGSGGPGSPSDEARKAEWSRLIVKLTPELNIEDDNVGKAHGTKRAPEIVPQKAVIPAAACHMSAETESGCTTPIPNPAPVATASATSSTTTIPKVTVSSLLSSPNNQSLPLPTLEPVPQNTTFKSLPQTSRLAALSTISPLKTPAVRLGSGNAMSSAAAAAQKNQLQRCTTEDMAFLSRKCPVKSDGEKSRPPSSVVRPTMLTWRSSLSCSMTSSPETLNDSDSSTSSSPFAFSRSSSISSASSFDSVGSLDVRRRCNKISRVISSAIAPAQHNSAKDTGLNTPTPSPPRYLSLRPKASKEFSPGVNSETKKSPLSYCRKRRICELALPIPETDNGVSPNLSSGMTPQMKVQLQMRTPPLNNGLGPKRLRCGVMEPSVLILPNRSGSQEEVL